MSSTYLTRTTGTPTNSKKFTVSGWFKIFDASENQFLQHFTDGNNREHMYFSASTLRWYCNSGGSTAVLMKPTMLFRDPNAFYHIVVACDTTQATASDRIKIYVNGSQITSFDTATYPSQNFDFLVNSNNKLLAIGRYMGTNNYYYDGIISHFHFIDGTQYQASDFGSTDSTTGEWKINPAPNVTYGNNGYWILKDGNSITDSSTNSNNWTLSGGTLTKTEDNPSNVFCTWNPLTNGYASATFSNGNNTVFFNNGNERHILGTLGMNSGKFYWESKLVSHSGDTYSKVGIESSLHDNAGGYEVDSYGYRGEGGGGGGATNSGRKVNNSTYTNWGSSFTTGDIIGCAVDLDNNKIYFSKNGTWQESGDPTSGSTGTGSAFNLIAPVSGFYHPSIGKEDSDTCTWSMNFGNGYFGTTAVSSAGTNASGNGVFEYDVPTGYTALSTKGLNL